ncbi:MAG: hypothetical protein NTZ83_03355, partial [Candidatus Pacearchaeota archaeon]|nr:hypothetical protein [Candidatus Pacearchaeota archaeon]
KAYNVLNTKEKKDAYIQAKVNEDWGNTIPPSSTDPRWDCAYYSMQLFVNSNELGENLHNKWGKDWGNHLLFNGYKGKNVDSIKYNHGTFYSMGDLGAPIYRASVIDSSHSTYGLRHVINWAATGYDLTKFEDINFTEPMDDSSNISIGRWDLPKNCDLVTLIYYYVVEDKTNGNYLQDINLEKFRIENGIPTLIWENTDQKYSIKKQRGK